jgi:hypothetical protein
MMDAMPLLLVYYIPIVDKSEKERFSFVLVNFSFTIVPQVTAWI